MQPLPEPRQADAPDSGHIEITPEMIGAGVRVCVANFEERFPISLYAEPFVREVFEQMARLAPRTTGVLKMPPKPRKPAKGDKPKKAQPKK